MPRALAGVALIAGTLALPAVAPAHVVPTPAFLPSESARSVDLTAPNERDDTMTGFRITAPAGLAIERAHDLVGWRTRLDGSSAEWTGGLLASDVEQTFTVTLAANTEPGIVELTAEQLYADGAVVSWRVPMTVTPAEDSPPEHLLLAGAVGLVGVFLVVAIALAAWRRRGPPPPTAPERGVLQER